MPVTSTNSPFAKRLTITVEPTVARWFSPETVASNPAYLDKIRGMIRATPVNGAP